MPAGGTESSAARRGGHPAPRTGCDIVIGENEEIAARDRDGTVPRVGTADVAGIMQHGDGDAACCAERDELGVAPFAAAIGGTVVYDDHFPRRVYDRVGEKGGKTPSRAVKLVVGKGDQRIRHVSSPCREPRQRCLRAMGYRPFRDSWPKGRESRSLRDALRAFPDNHMRFP